MKRSTIHHDLIMIGTDPDAKGGIATVVTKYREFGLFEKWKVTYLISHVEGSLGRKLATAFSAYYRLIVLLLTGHVGLVHIHLASRASTWRKSIYALTAFLFRTRYVLHLHGAEFTDFFYKECGPLRRQIIRGLLQKAATVIALSESRAAQLGEMAPGARVEVIYNSVSLPLRQKKYGSSEGNKDILFLGKIGRRKGTFDLIHAFAVLDGDAKLVLGGDGAIDSAAELARELGVSERVRLLGWVSGEDKNELLSEAAVLVLPSYNEGLPISILEAMAWGIPVITTPVGGIPEVIRQGEEGFIVQPGDIGGLAAALHSLLDDAGLRQRQGNKGRERIQHVFSDDAVLPRLEAIWLRLGLLPLSISKASDDA